MEANNFQKLMNEEEERYLQQENEPVRAKVWGTLDLFRLVGDMTDLFLPRAMDVFIMVAGGRGDDNDKEKEYMASPGSLAGNHGGTPKRKLPEP